MEKIDLASWPRREAFEHFSRVSWPFYSVTFDVDVTQVSRYTKEKGVSFYYTMTWLVTRAVEQVEALMLDIRDGEVWRLDHRLPSFTDLKPGAEQFHIVTLPMEDCVPRIAWGRWTEQGGRKILGLSVEVNHRTVDGLHIGRFAQALEREIEALP